MVISPLMEEVPWYTLARGWFNPEKEQGRPELKGLKPHQLLLLLSDGSMTLELELLSGGRVEVEVMHRGTTRLDDSLASYLEEKPGTDALVRDVWLTDGKKKLVYAHSLIPLSRLRPGLIDELERYSNEPLGRVLNSNKIFFCKERLEVATVECGRVSKAVGKDPASPLAARRYILFNRQGKDDWVIKASVLEIFSPEVVPCH
ncbi:MAG: chorismate lyase [Deltaproteobacteria bacterium]|nr:chorismate lyase [Deltaproteobacteria bacterium]